MTYVKSEIRAGAFILVAIALLTVAIFAVGDIQLLGSTDRHTYSTVVPDARFLREGRPVTIAGYEVGRIEKIEIRPDGRAEITFWIAGHQLRDGCTIELRQDGLMGQKYLEVLGYHADRAALDDGSQIDGDTLTDMNRMVAELRPVVQTFADPAFRDQLRKTATTVEEVARNANLLVDTMRTRLDGITPMLKNANGLVTDVRVALEENAKVAAEALANLRQASADLPPQVEQTLTDVRGLVSDARGLVLDVRADLVPTMHHAREAAFHAEMLVRKVRANPAVLLFGDDEQVAGRSIVDDSARRDGGRMPRFGQRP